MVASGLAFEDIHDLIGIRVIVDDVRDCYGVLGLVHTMWPPIQGRFKDYIAMPKFNFYQSLHTTVVGPMGRPSRCRSAHRRCTSAPRPGSPPTGGTRRMAGATGEFPVVQDIRDMHDEAEDPTPSSSRTSSSTSTRTRCSPSRPKGDVKTLPKGATPVDFAYRIHTDVGHRCQGAKVNGRLVPLSTELESGDIVQIITSKAQDAHPSSRTGSTSSSPREPHRRSRHGSRGNAVKAPSPKDVKP